MNLEHVGTPIGPMTRIHGGFANRVHRLDTDQGNIVRCLAGVEAGTGPDLSLSHDSVRNGVRGVMFRRLPSSRACSSDGRPSGLQPSG